MVILSNMFRSSSSNDPINVQFGSKENRFVAKFRNGGGGNTPTPSGLPGQIYGVDDDGKTRWMYLADLGLVEMTAADVDHILGLE